MVRKRGKLVRARRPLFNFFSSLRASSLWHSGGGREKEGELATMSLNFGYLHRKVDAKCWLAKVTLVVTSLSFARVFQCLFTFVLVSASR